MQSNQVLTYDEVKSFFKNAPLYFAEGESFEEAIEVFKKSQKPKPDYEIRSFVDNNIGSEFFTKDIDGRFRSPFHPHAFNEQRLIQSKFPIHSVKRLSDGELFAIGDKVYWDAEVDNDITTITEFRLLPERLNVYGEGFGILLEALKKVKPQPKEKLGTTDDKVDVFEYDTFPVYKVLISNFAIQQFAACDAFYKSGHKYFYDKKNAENYIIANKTLQVSYQDFKSYFQDVNVSMEEIYKFFKQKINP